MAAGEWTEVPEPEAPSLMSPGLEMPAPTSPGPEAPSLMPGLEMPAPMSPGLAAPSPMSLRASDASLYAVLPEAPPAIVRAADPGEAGPSAIAVARELGVSITMGDLLHRSGRGVDDATRRFLDPKLGHLTAPEKMVDRDAAAERLAAAIRGRERICVFGDYDCDGITATAVMTSVLRSLGAEVAPLLASRASGGYGFSAPALERVRETGATLLVTCDCGSSDHERLAGARAAGIDAIVIDHHLVPPEPLPVLAFLNPHRDDCGFPFKGLASCGLALSLGAALRQRMGATLDLRPLLDLVAVGTIADVAPLESDNRALVRAGLAVIAQGSRPGLRAIAELGKLDLAYGVTGEDVSFRLAPRLNAPGRLGAPDLSLELLLAKSASEAAAIAASIEQITTRRRAIQEEMIADAIGEIESAGFGTAPAIVLARQGWHPGIVGIVAGRIASRYGKPTIVIGLEGAAGRGSVRGPQGFRLHDALVRSRSDLVSFGGHQAAAGVDVRADRVAALRDAFCEACAAQGSASLAPEISAADARLDDRDDPAVVVRDLARLEPCGEANRAPRLLLGGAKVRSARDVKGHLKVELAFGGRTIPGFAFSIGEKSATLAGARVDVVGALRRDTYRGGEAVEVRIDAISLAE